MESQNLMILVLLPLLNMITAEHANSTCAQGPTDAGPWSALLEEWATTPSESHRQGRILTLTPSNGYYVTDRMDRRPYEEWPGLTPPPPPHPGKIVNRPPNPYKDKMKPGYISGKPVPPQRPATVDRVDAEPQRKEVSETDLYLLGAIEKLVYRMDIMEKRLRKAEESLHYMVAGNDITPDPCVANFTRVGSACYLFSREQYDWKTANLACRKLRSNLLELETERERRQLAAAVLVDGGLRGSDYWTGGLNPGLLWIWSNSARPVAGNGTSGPNATRTEPAPVVGEGRCLSLAYDPATRAYGYRGRDCALRQRFICEKAEDETALSNEIARVARTLKARPREARGEEEGKEPTEDCRNKL